MLSYFYINSILPFGQVGFLTNANKTQCLCNHLTSFGGDFVVPPNSIDWSAVSAGFANLDENPVVFAVVVSIIGVYFILLLWVRRLDKKDLKEVTITTFFSFLPSTQSNPTEGVYAKIYEKLGWAGLGWAEMD